MADLTYRTPGSLPMKRQAQRRAGHKRVGGLAVSKTYGKRDCRCGAPLSRYNPDKLCRLCTVRGES